MHCVFLASNLEYTATNVEYRKIKLIIILNKNYLSYTLLSVRSTKEMRQIGKDRVLNCCDLNLNMSKDITVHSENTVFPVYYEAILYMLSLMILAHQSRSYCPI